jgi:hypothetical protein
MVRRVIAAVLDFFTIFFVGGFAIGAVTGEAKLGSFNLQGTTALLLFALIAVYFFVGSRYLGGTLWQRILRTRR